MIKFKLFTAIIILASMFAAPVQAAISEPKLSADSAILIEASTGRVIFEKNADDVRPPASMTKMVTCILGLEMLLPEEQITITSEAADTEDSSLFLSTGDNLSGYELLRGMMLVSDNGAAVAIAQAISGSVELFSQNMNELAINLDCVDTHFANPNGLPNINHYSTARDMAKIASYCMQNWEFRDIVGTQRETIHWTVPDYKTIKVDNTNRLLGKYRGANGIKTGWTTAAGGCLAASAKRDGVELIAIIMHSEDSYTRFEDAEALLDYGFEKIQDVAVMEEDDLSEVVFIRGGKHGILKVAPQDDLIFPLFNGEDEAKISITDDLPKIMDAEIRKGQIVGRMIIKYDGEIVSTVPYIAKEDIAGGFSIPSKIVGWTEPIINVAGNFFQSILA